MEDILPDSPDAAKLEFEQKKFAQETKFRQQEIELKQREQTRLENEAHRSRWWNPLVLAIAGATLATAGNAIVAALNGKFQREMQMDNNTYTNTLEELKEESARILAVIRTDPKTSTANLNFLVRAKLVTNPAIVEAIEALPGATAANSEKQAPSLPSLQSLQNSLESENTSVRREERQATANQGLEAIPLLTEILASNRSHAKYELVIGAIDILAKMPREVRCLAYAKNGELRSDVEKHGGIQDPTVSSVAKRALDCAD